MISPQIVFGIGEDFEEHRALSHRTGECAEEIVELLLVVSVTVHDVVLATDALCCGGVHAHNHAACRTLAQSVELGKDLTTAVVEQQNAGWYSTVRFGRRKNSGRR